MQHLKLKNIKYFQILIISISKNFIIWFFVLFLITLPILSLSLQNSLYISLDNGSTIDVRLVTDQGRCCTTKPETESARHYSRLETPSPTLSSSSTHSMTSGGTLQQTTTKANLVNDEHTYFCNPEMKEEMEALENKLTARIILQNCTAGHSLRRFFPDDPHMGK